jgi:hypothetical protein
LISSFRYLENHAANLNQKEVKRVEELLRIKRIVVVYKYFTTFVDLDEVIESKPFSS